MLLKSSQISLKNPNLTMRERRQKTLALVGKRKKIFQPGEKAPKIAREKLKKMATKVRIEIY